MKVLIDAGNTRIKWRLAGRPQVTAVATTEELLAGLSALDGAPSEVAVASVAGPVFGSDLKSALATLAPESVVRFAAVQPEFAGLRIAYRDPAQLGVDRWLGMLAAQFCAAEGRMKVVISAGSAITCDFVSSGGDHLGGLILPGVRLMKDSLMRNTAAVRPGALTLPQSWRPGCSTVACVDAGLSAVLSGVVTQITDFVGGQSADYLVTGGDAQLLMARLEQRGIPAEGHESLALDGLEHWLIHSESL